MTSKPPDWPKGRRASDKLEKDFEKSAETQLENELERPPQTPQFKLELRPPGMSLGDDLGKPGKQEHSASVPKIERHGRPASKEEITRWANEQKEKLDATHEKQGKELERQHKSALHEKTLDLDQRFDQVELKLNDARKDIQARLDRGGMKGFFFKLSGQERDDRNELAQMDRHLEHARESKAREMGQFQQRQHDEREHFETRQEREVFDLQAKTERAYEHGRIPEQERNPVEHGHSHDDDTDHQL